MTGAVRIVQRNALVYRRVWRGSVFSSFLQPTLFLLSIGLGLGPLVDSGHTPLPGNVPFLHFLAPGLLAAACMQTASFESSWPVAAKILWRHNYDAMMATPMRIDDLVLGELAWIAIRLATVAIAFATVMTAFGILWPSRALVLAIASAVLTGLAFSAAIMAYAATLKNGQNFNVLFRFVVTPLFLFSGVFFPTSRLPRPLQTVAWVSPLFHGVELVRGLTLHTIQSPAWIIHVTYLVAMVAIGIVVAQRTFRRRLYA